MRIDSIVLGDRVRKDMGDIEALAKSIESNGLLHPIVVKPDGTLISGHRRLDAVRMLGWEDVPARVVDVPDLLAAERDENSVRKDFTPTEAVAIGRLIEEEHRAKIAVSRPEQMRSAVARRSDRAAPTSGVNHPVVGALGSTRSVASRAVGMSEKKYYQAKKVVQAAESAPEKFGDLTDLMDETGNVSGTHRELERRRNSDDTKKHGRHRIHGRSRLSNHNSEMERATNQLDAVVRALESIAKGSLDPALVPEWIASLEKSRSVIGQVIRRMRSE